MGKLVAVEYPAVAFSCCLQCASACFAPACSRPNFGAFRSRAESAATTSFSKKCSSDCSGDGGEQEREQAEEDAVLRLLQLRPRLRVQVRRGAGAAVREPEALLREEREGRDS